MREYRGVLAGGVWIFGVLLPMVYTNNADLAVFGYPISLTDRTVVLSNDMETIELPLSVFPSVERRRIAAEYLQAHPKEGIGVLALPRDVRLALAGHDESVRRSQTRQAKGLCSEAENEDFCVRSDEALKRYLDKQVDQGRLLPLERQLIERSAER